MSVTGSTAPGLTGYKAAILAMKGRVAAIRAGEADEALWFVEHPPLYTAGTSARADDLEDAGRFPTHAAGRGGQWTYHGPGQRVAYVMLDLAQAHGEVPARDVRAFVTGLERWLILALGRMGVVGEIRPGRVGIWVVRPGVGGGPAREDKIAAIGVRVTRWVSWHGVSLNVDPVLEHFSGIVPCGIREHGVTSLRDLGLPATMQDADAAMLASWAEVFGPLGATGGSMP